jgi:threonine/homoserine/homoserine lactone efflux protein
MFKESNCLAPAPVAGDLKNKNSNLPGPVPGDLKNENSNLLAPVAGDKIAVLNQIANKPNIKTSFYTGFILSATNPYFLLWWATVGLNLAKDAINLGVLAIILFAIVHSLCDLVWLEIISFTSYKGARLLNERNQRIILAACSAAIIFFGLYFIYKSIILL